MIKQKKSLGRKLKAYLPLYLMMVPGAVYLIINNYIPMAGISIAFEQFNYSKGMWGSPFIGLKNFEFLFKTKDAWIITRNTILYNVAFIVLGTVFAIAVAVLLNEIHSSRAKKLYQTTILVPFLISIVVVSYLVYAFLSSDSGFINKTLLPALGKEPISWYTSAQYWPFILILVNIWKGLGYTYVYRGLMSLNNISMASAAGVYQSLIGFLLVLVANFVVKKLSAENALF